MPHNKTCNISSWLFIAVLSWKRYKRFVNGEEKKNKVTEHMWHLVLYSRTPATIEDQQRGMFRLWKRCSMYQKEADGCTSFSPEYFYLLENTKLSWNRSFGKLHLLRCKCPSAWSQLQNTINKIMKSRDLTQKPKLSTEQWDCFLKDMVHMETLASNKNIKNRGKHSWSETKSHLGRSQQWENTSEIPVQAKLLCLYQWGKLS